MKRALLALVAMACVAAAAIAQNRAAKPLTIYVVDVEGGNGVLFVSPTGESLLMDPGNAGGAAQRNPECANFQPIDANMEDPMSVGILVSYGKFRALHLGDNTRNKEFELACPVNRIGTVDLMLGMHHGQSSSNSPVLVHAVRPRVAIVNNGTRKGGEPDRKSVV